MRNDITSNIFKLFVVVGLVTIAFVASGCSGTSLRCGITDDGSYVDLVNVPQDLSSNSRYFGELCGFALQEVEPSSS